MFEVKRQPLPEATALIRPATKLEYMEYTSMIKNVSQEAILDQPKNEICFKYLKSNSANGAAQNLLFINKRKND